MARALLLDGVLFGVPAGAGPTAGMRLVGEPSMERDRAVGDPRPGAAVALAGCRVLRPPFLAEHVEITVARGGLRSFPLRVSDSLGVCLKTGQEHRVCADGKQVLYPEDAVCVRPPGCVWESEPAVASFVSIDVWPALLGEPMAVAGLMQESMTFLTGPGLVDLGSLIGSLLRAESSLEAEGVVAQIVSATARREVPPGDVLLGSVRRRAVTRACEFLGSRLELRPTLDQAASAAETNKYVLMRDFRKELGTTPHAYLVMLRLNRARSLLARGASAVEVAHEAGFADQAHLSRWFKRAHGLTPVEYARELRSVVAIPQSISFKTHAELPEQTATVSHSAKQTSS